MTQYKYSYSDLDALFSGHRTLRDFDERWTGQRLWSPPEAGEPPPPDHRDVSAPRRFQPPSAVEPEPPAKTNGVRVCACDKPMLQLQWTGFNSRLTASCLKCGRNAEQPADRRFDGRRPDDVPSPEMRSMAATNRGLRYV
jgi:hypothetical protein